jgi:hypothetical protein
MLRNLLNGDPTQQLFYVLVAIRLARHIDRDSAAQMIAPPSVRPTLSALMPPRSTLLRNPADQWNGSITWDVQSDKRSHR